MTFTPVSAENDTRVASADDSTFFIRALNTTDIRHRLRNDDDIASITPRWLLPVTIANPNQKDLAYSAIMLIINTKEEREKGVGRLLEAPDLDGTGCWIT